MDDSSVTYKVIYSNYEDNEDWEKIINSQIGVLYSSVSQYDTGGSGFSSHTVLIEIEGKSYNIAKILNEFYIKHDHIHN